MLSAAQMPCYRELLIAVVPPAEHPERAYGLWTLPAANTALIAITAAQRKNQSSISSHQACSLRPLCNSRIDCDAKTNQMGRSVWGGAGGWGSACQVSRMSMVDLLRGGNPQGGVAFFEVQSLSSPDPGLTDPNISSASAR